MNIEKQVIVVELTGVVKLFLNLLSALNPSLDPGKLIEHPLTHLFPLLLQQTDNLRQPHFFHRFDNLDFSFSWHSHLARRRLHQAPIFLRIEISVS